MVPDLWTGIDALFIVGPSTIPPVVLRTPLTTNMAPAPALTYLDVPTKSTSVITAAPICIGTIIDEQGNGAKGLRYRSVMLFVKYGIAVVWLIEDACCIL